jgi:hypothetical protein
MNTCTVVVEGLFGVRTARNIALKRCVFDHAQLYAEFMQKYFRIGMSTDEYTEAKRNFIKEKGLRIISEKPVARTEGDRYVVDVYFTVAW